MNICYNIIGDIMTKRMTNKEFLTKLTLKYGTEFSILSLYVKSSIKILVKHNICGNVWKVTPNNLLRGRKCPKCKNRISPNDFSDRVYKETNGNLKVVGKYIDCDIAVKVLCKKHGCYFYIKPRSCYSSTRSKYKCPKCRSEAVSKETAKDQNTFLKELKLKHHGSIVCLDKYVNTHTKLHFKCLKCNHVFFSEPNSVIRLSGCPTCAESHGEKAITYFLEDKNIEFERQKSFNDCKYKRELKFDFFLPEKNMFIEYDGMQHFKPIEFFGGDKAYKHQKHLDSIKDKYALKKGIKMVRIKYTPSLDILNKELINIFCKK